MINRPISECSLELQSHFNFENIKITSIDFTDTLITAHGEDVNTVLKCQHCGSNRINLNGHLFKKITDTPFDGLPVKINLKIQAYLCRDCRKATRATTPELSSSHYTTTRLLQFVKDNSNNSTLPRLAAAVGVSLNSINLYKRSEG